VSNVSTEWARSASHDGGMNTTDHRIGDHVSVRCKRSYRPGDHEVTWLAGRIIARDVGLHGALKACRYVVQLDDDRRVVAFDDDVRRWTLAFDICEMLEKMAS
jgi:hypothetical protein